MTRQIYVGVTEAKAAIRSIGSRSNHAVDAVLVVQTVKTTNLRSRPVALPGTSRRSTASIKRRSAARSTSRPIRIVRRTAATRSRAFLAVSPCARRPSAPPPTSSAARRRDLRSRASRHLSRRPPGRVRQGSQAPARVASIPPPPIPASATRSRRPTTGARRPRSGARRARARETGARVNE